MVRVLAVIPARGGSKRLSGKNVRLLGGKPLIVWTIETAREVPAISEVLLSTDDEGIAEVARSAGASAPWLRPAELATDAARSEDVCIHALDWYEEQSGPVDGLVLLQPTSPFRSAETIRRGLRLFVENGSRPVVALSPAKRDRAQGFELDGLRLVQVERPAASSTPMSEARPLYEPNGALYVIAPGDLRKYRSFYGGDVLGLVIEDAHEAIDIDTASDWLEAVRALEAT
jgi:CMP-N,N'-diacetyllegionaminic acid synthase